MKVNPENWNDIVVGIPPNNGGDVFGSQQEQSRTVPDEYVDIKRIAALTGLSIRTLYRYVAQGMIPYYRMEANRISFRIPEVIDWMEFRPDDDDEGGNGR